MSICALLVRRSGVDAAQNQGYKCLTPQAVLEELEALTRDKSVYEFLQQGTKDR